MYLHSHFYRKHIRWRQWNPNSITTAEDWPRLKNRTLHPVHRRHNVQKERGREGIANYFSAPSPKFEDTAAAFYAWGLENACIISQQKSFHLNETTQSCLQYIDGMAGKCRGKTTIYLSELDHSGAHSHWKVRLYQTWENFVADMI